MNFVGRVFLWIDPASCVHVADLRILYLADDAFDHGGMSAVERAQAQNLRHRIGFPDSLQVSPVERCKHPA